MALTDIFHPTKWINITRDIYYITFDKKERTPTFTPTNRDEVRSDAPVVKKRRRRREVSTEDLRRRETEKRRQWVKDVRERARLEDEEKEKKRKEEEEKERQRQLREERRRQAERREREEAEKKQRENFRREEEAKRRQWVKDVRERARVQEQTEKEKGEETNEQGREASAEEENETTEVTSHSSPPPELTHYQVRNVAHTKWRIPSAYYPSIDSVLENINEHTKDVYKNDEGDGSLLSMDQNKGKVRLRLKPGIHIRLSRKLADLMGFKNLHQKGPTSRLAEYPPNLKRHLGSLHVYLSAMQDRVVGDTMAPLIGLVPHVDTFPAGLKIAHHTFLRPYYFPVKQKFLDTITCNIRDDKGDLVTFDEGSTTLTLHLVRSSP